MFDSIGVAALKAALSHYESESRTHRANLMVYLSNPVGVGEHPNIVEEVVNLTKLITEAEENIRTLEGFISGWYQNQENIKSHRGEND